MTTTERNTWKDSDFRAIFAALDNVREVLTACPHEAAEFAPVLIDDIDAAADSLRCIARATGAII